MIYIFKFYFFRPASSWQESRIWPPVSQKMLPLFAHKTDLFCCIVEVCTHNVYLYKMWFLCLKSTHTLLVEILTAMTTVMVMGRNEGTLVAKQPHKVTALCIILNTYIIFLCLYQKYIFCYHWHCHSWAQQVREDNHLQRSAPPEHAMDAGGDMLAGRRTFGIRGVYIFGNYEYINHLYSSNIYVHKINYRIQQ